MSDIFFFSNNGEKIEEIKKIFSSLRINILAPNDFDIIFEPKEGGMSFAENAKIKSFFGYKKTQMPCFADDSGISIEALGWKPNIYSRRFIDSFECKRDCFKYIFKKIDNGKGNKAVFQTSICLTLKESYHIIFEGKVNGTISDKVLGNYGFGYDPIFIPDGYKETYGEMKSNIKNLISHRAIAVNKLINFLSV